MPGCFRPDLLPEGRSARPQCAGRDRRFRTQDGRRYQAAAASERVYEFLEEKEMSDQKDLNKKLDKTKVKGEIVLIIS